VLCYFQIAFEKVYSFCRLLFVIFVVIIAACLFLFGRRNFQTDTVRKQPVMLRWFQETKSHFQPGLAHNVTRQRKPSCSFNLFRQIVKYSAKGYLPGNGTWKRNKRGELDRFDPSICRLKYGMEMPSQKIATCLRKENLRHIVIMGDSNGRRYFRALHERLNQLQGVECTKLSSHHCVNWSTYEQDMFLYHRCRCGSTYSGRCAVCFQPFTRDMRNRPFNDTFGWSLQAECHINISKEGLVFSFIIEFSALRRLMDNTIVVLRSSGCQPSENKPVIPTKSETSQQFLFAEFYANPRPDLFIVFGNAHDRMLLPDLSRFIDKFVRLIDRYVMPPTKFIWLSRMAEDVRRKPKYWRELRYERGTMTRLEWLDAANRIMYSKLRQRFLQKKSLLLFPDLLQMSVPVLDDFNIDGVHMKPGWYKHVLSYLIQTICSEA